MIPGSGKSPGEGVRQPTPVFLPGELHGQRSLAGFSPWGRRELDRTERLTHTHTQSQGCHSLPLSEHGLCAKDTSPLLYIQYLFYLIQKDRRLCLMLPQEG